MRHTTMTICCGLVLTAIVGCGGGSDHPPTVRAGGKVTLSGQPVANATVVFTGEGQTALAITGDDGNFKLTTFEDGDGAVEGSYKVSVVKVVGGDSGGGGDDSMEAAVKADTGGGAKSALPRRYGDPNTSGLQFTVKKGEENNFEVQLSP